MKKRLLVLALLGSVLGQPAVACRLPIPSAKFKHSDVVVDGMAICLESPGTCKLTVERVLKGKKTKSDASFNIAVNESPIENQVGEEVVIGGNCPQTFEPQQPVTHGRFYLTVKNDGTLFAAYPADINTEKK
jgi:hypothetical protein